MGIKKTVMHNDFVEDDLKLPGRRVSLPVGGDEAKIISINGVMSAINKNNLNPGSFGDNINVNYTIANFEPNKQYKISGVGVPFLRAESDNVWTAKSDAYALFDPVIVYENTFTTDVNGSVVIPIRIHYVYSNLSGTPQNIKIACVLNWTVKEV